jgi:phosphohistidine phosphatase
VSGPAAAPRPGRVLVLLRHAKSDWPDVADHDRPLARRGRRDAPVVGRWLGTSGYLPDAVVCSTARRARETWALAGPAILLARGATSGTSAEPASQPADRPGAAPAVRFEPRVYEASVLGLMMLVREFEPGWHTVLMVGHNPGLAELTIGLAGSELEPPRSFPTAFAAVLALPGEWADASPGEGRLLAFTTPAQLRG